MLVPIISSYVANAIAEYVVRYLRRAETVPGLPSPMRVNVIRAESCGWMVENGVRYKTAGRFSYCRNRTYAPSIHIAAPWERLTDHAIRTIEETIAHECWHSRQYQSGIEPNETDWRVHQRAMWEEIRCSTAGTSKKKRTRT